MLEVEKTPHISHTLIEIEGILASRQINRLLNKLDKELGLKAHIYEGERPINLSDTDWYKETSTSMTPGDYVKIYRENKGWNQTKLGNQLGNYSRQYISDIETGRRNISKELAKKLSSLLKVPVSRFI